MTCEKDQIKFKELTKVHGRLRNEAKDLFSQGMIVRYVKVSI